MICILLVGGCGSGKTWVMEQVIKKYKLDTLGKVGMFYFHRNEKIIALGKYDGSTFQGSDKLSMAIMRDLSKFVKHAKGKIVICEGDRFTNSTFISKVKPIIVKIADTGEKGRKKRKSNQSARMIKSIQTRVNNIKNEKHLVLNSDVALETVVGIVKENV
jgi:hypothetical protein